MSKQKPLKIKSEIFDMYPAFLLDNIFFYLTEAPHYYPRKSKNNIRAVVLPYQHHLYTGTLQAIGHYILNRSNFKFKKIIILNTTDTNELTDLSNGVFVPESSLFAPVFGKGFEISNELKEKFITQTDFEVIQADQAFITNHNIFSQLPFFSVLYSDIAILPVIIGQNTNLSSLSSFLSKILKDESVGIIFQASLYQFGFQSVSGETDNLEETIANNIEHFDALLDSIDPNLVSFPDKDILSLFVNVAKTQNKKITTHVFTNSLELGLVSSNVQGYGVLSW